MSRDKLARLIESAQERIEDDVRDYIGASSIGSDCLRQIWYQFKGIKAEKVPTKFRRTWDIGKRLEGLILDWLENAGVKIERVNVKLNSKNIPAFQGHIDALAFIDDKSSILEVKTAKDASFKIFVKKGAKIWNFQYYAQIQSYMGMSGIFSAYILVLNKDNSDISDELVTFDEDFYNRLEDKAQMIYGANIEPPKINGSPLWFQCKMCKFNKVCHK